MSAADLITSTLAYSALAYTPPPFVLVNGEVRRTEGYVVVVRAKEAFEFRVAMAGESWHAGNGKKLSGGVVIACDASEFAPNSSLLDVTGRKSVLSRDCAEALFADVCADLRHGGALTRQWCATLPFQVVLAKCGHGCTPCEYVPMIYASGPRWRPTKERPTDDTP